MALEAVVFPQGLFGYNGKELYGLGGEVWDCGGLEEEGRSWGLSCSSVVQSLEEWDMMNSSSPEAGTTNKEGGFSCELGKEGEVEALGRRKRRRTRSHKNKEEVENQRMTHIAVERNRRKQMNEYLTVLRSLMPANYVQRGDQASIIGGAINFVKELEQLLQSLEAHKQIKQQSNGAAGSSSLPFASFFSFPQYSSCSSVSANTNTSTMNTNNTTAEVMAKNRSAVADIEVTMVESHANLKILAPQRPKQLLKIVLGLQGLRLTTLHLNVTTVDEMVLHSFSLKVEDDCRLNSVDEIATAVYQMVGRIQEEANVI